MKIFRVGGSVRDALLGLPVQDLDYVVVGATPEQMLAAGFTPVGKDFPVFLHPQTHAEYALARTERKSAPGYHGFVFHCAPDVTIEQDLQRRDLTINAMAIEEVSNHGGNQASDQIIDPFGGQQDLANRVLRHVSDAFSEDPVRILRVARFAARFNTFSIAPQTMQLMRDMVQSGEVNALVPERVWQEIARGLMEQQPSRMLEVLRTIGALRYIAPELDEILLGSNEKKVKAIVDCAAQQELSLAARWAAMLAACDNDGPKNGSELVAPSIEQHGITQRVTQRITQLHARLKTPLEVRDIALLVLRERVHIEQAVTLPPEAVVHLLERCDAFRRPTRLNQIIQAALCLTYSVSNWPEQVYLERALAAAKAIPSSTIVETTKSRFPNQPEQIAKAISAARIEAVKKLQKQT